MPQAGFPRAMMILEVRLHLSDAPGISLYLSTRYPLRYLVQWNHRPSGPHISPCLQGLIPRYAAQREASMAESLAYVAARCGRGK